MDKFKGIGVALVTPFKENGEVDYKSLEKLVRHNIDGGINYLVVQGTTGETATLTTEEKQNILDFVIEINQGKLPLVLGIGGNNTTLVKDQLKKVEENDKIDAILSVSPYYNCPTQEGIYLHYKTLAESTSKNIIIYNVPGRTGSNISPDTTIRLANDFKNIIGIKDASGQLDQIMTIIKNKPEGFLVISGDDALTLPIISTGGNGVISVIGNAYPKEFTSMVNNALKNNIKEAQKEFYLLFDMIQHIFKEGNPGGIKEILHHLNICEKHLRLPLVNVSTELSNKLYKLATEIK